MKFKNYIYLILGASFIAFSIILKLHNDDGEKAGFDHPEGFSEYFRGITVPIGQAKSGYKPNYAFKEYYKAKHAKRLSLKSTEEDFNWVQRGPANVGGRTRTVIVDPSDTTGNTWFAGSVSGGVWKTTDGGQTWTNLTPDLPNLSTAAIAMAPSDLNVIYAGTGEGYGGEGMVTGNGIFISTDKGSSWQLIKSTANDEKFRYVNKIWVDPSNDSILVAATNKGLYKSFNAGNSWVTAFEEGYPVQDISQNPLNPKILYAGANTLGVLKSYDAGDNWVNSSEGFGECYRVSVSVSPADTSYIYAGVEGPNSQTLVYHSGNSGASWNLNRNADGLFINFHQLQGWFNNAIAAHPFDKNKVYIGGVYVGLLDFKRTTYTSTPQVVRVDTSGTGRFMTFIHFGGSRFSGGLATGTDEEADVETDDYVSVELRFGPGVSQKAHRFTVPDGEGAGVPSEDYSYIDYVDVPFEAWDIDNNRQLMVSFRDQDKNGKFNLTERKYNDDISGREYIFISAKTYNPSSPDVDIATNGGYLQKLLYFVWPTLPEHKTWNPDSIPQSVLKVKFGSINYQDAYTTVLADDRLNDSLHVDHHDIKFFITDSTNKKFNIIETNDGGLGFSSDEGKTWKQINKGYLTTQFYGIAKRPGAHEYIGGMQDNGTWQSPLNAEAGKNSNYKFQIEGDGFEALWHPWYPNRILGSSYNNYIKVSDDYGENWQWSTDGINGDGPFITKLSNSRENPNLVFAVGSKGLFKHVNFGFGRYNWELINLGDGWALDNTVTSMHHVKVSKAKPSVVWAGGGMFNKPDLYIFLSKDYGVNFDTVPNYKDVELGYISGLATHPVNPAEAFVLFSYNSKPKILRTYDYGQHWQDISGFGKDSTSSNGFPDVVVNDLFVFPDDTNRIWVGTEIGLFESTDNGQSWHIANNGLPPVSIWQLQICDNEILVATHGRGIWTAELATSSLPKNPLKNDFSIYPNPASEYFTIHQEVEGGGGIEVKIYKISGTLVFDKKYSLAQHDIEVDASDFNVGNYIVTLTGNKLHGYKKLIITR